jgi:hypothetical protein
MASTLLLFPSPRISLNITYIAHTTLFYRFCMFMVPSALAPAPPMGPLPVASTATVDAPPPYAPPPNTVASPAPVTDSTITATAADASPSPPAYAAPPLGPSAPTGTTPLVPHPPPPKPGLSDAARAAALATVGTVLSTGIYIHFHDAQCILMTAFCDGVFSVPCSRLQARWSLPVLKVDSLLISPQYKRLFIPPLLALLLLRHWSQLSLLLQLL